MSSTPRVDAIMAGNSDPLRDALESAVAREWDSIFENKHRPIQITRIANTVIDALVGIARIEPVTNWSDADNTLMARIRGEIPVPEGVEARLCKLITDRQQLGLRKYGVSLENSPEDKSGKLRHLLTELCDAAAYTLWNLEETEKGTKL